MSTLIDVRHQLDKRLAEEVLRAWQDGRTVSFAMDWQTAMRSATDRRNGKKVATIAVPRELAEEMLWHLEELRDRRASSIRGDMRDYRLTREAAEARAPSEIDIWGPGLPKRSRKLGRPMEKNLAALLDLTIRRDLKELKARLRASEPLRKRQVEELRKHYPDMPVNPQVEEIAARALLSFVVMDESGVDVRYGGLNVEDCPVKSWSNVIDRAKRRAK